MTSTIALKIFHLPSHCHSFITLSQCRRPRTLKGLFDRSFSGLKRLRSSTYSNLTSVGRGGSKKDSPLNALRFPPPSVKVRGSSKSRSSDAELKLRFKDGFARIAFSLRVAS